MILFRKQKSKKLNLREVHELYILLRHCLPQKEESYLIDEIDKMVDMMESAGVLIKALNILYPKKKINQNNPIELLFLFVQGLKQNEFFDYVLFLNTVRHGRRSK